MDVKSKKFWNIELEGASYKVTYGRIGTDGQTSEKSFPTEEKARAAMEKLVQEKLSKGYVAAAGSGTSVDGSAPDGQIPLIAFSSIVHQDDISNNASSIIGIRVLDYHSKKTPKSDVAYRFRSDWETNELVPNLEHYLATDAALEAKAIVIGAWHGDDPELGPEEVISVLVDNRDRLPQLAAIYIGDITSEENEMSWINQGDLSPLLKAFPTLQFLRSRGGMGLELKSPQHSNLRALTVESGGLDASVIRSICTSTFPNLEYLELWLGTGDYGGTSTVADLQPILSGKFFPKLKHLGLRNCEYADDIAGVIVNSPVLERIETLDLSLGVLTDVGGKALLNLMGNSSLKKLNLHYNYFSAGVIKDLKKLPFPVDTSKPSNMEEDDEWRFVAVGE